MHSLADHIIVINVSAFSVGCVSVTLVFNGEMPMWIEFTFLM